MTDELRAFARTHAAIRAGFGNTDDILAFANLLDSYDRHRQDEERRRLWHSMDIDHDQPFEQCDSDICRGRRPVPA